MSLESVAAAAGTTVPSLRRRYQTKLQLATAVIDSLRVQPLPKPTGTPRVDAAEILANFQSNLLRLHGMATVGTILAEEQRNPELLAHFRQHLVEPRRAAPDARSRCQDRRTPGGARPGSHRQSAHRFLLCLLPQDRHCPERLGRAGPARHLATAGLKRPACRPIAEVRRALRL
jgi:AcrR family transcriptional regulator